MGFVTLGAVDGRWALTGDDSREVASLYSAVMAASVAAFFGEGMVASRSYLS